MRLLRKISGIISNILLVVFIILCGLIAHNLYKTWEVKETHNELSEIRVASKAKEIPGDWSNGMLSLNKDYVGWLTVYGTDVDYPVLKGKNNSTYHRRNFYGEYSFAGSIYMEETTDMSTPGNRIIYGHNMTDDTMFGSLDKYKNVEFFKENNIIRWEEETGTYYYKIFAALVVPGDSDAGGFINFLQWNNQISVFEAEDMLEELKSRAAIYQEGWTSDDDTYMFLITCDYTRNDGRLVLVGRSIPSEEK